MICVRLKQQISPSAMEDYEQRRSESENLKSYTIK